MWAIRLIDGKPSIIYLREMLLEGRILVFDREEGALRFMADVRGLESALQVRMRPERYSGDPRKDKPYKVPESNIGMLAEYLLAMV